MLQCLRVRILITSTVCLESKQKKCDDLTGSVVLVEFRDYNQNICQELISAVAKPITVIEVKPSPVTLV